MPALVRNPRSLREGKPSLFCFSAISACLTVYYQQLRNIGERNLLNPEDSVRLSNVDKFQQQLNDHQHLEVSSIPSLSPYTTCSFGSATFPSKEIVSRGRDRHLVLPIARARNYP